MKCKTLCNISRSTIVAAVKNGVKKIQATAYNGVRTVFNINEGLGLLKLANIVLRLINPTPCYVNNTNETS